MTKNRRNKKTYKRSQRGGVWPFSGSDPTAPSLTSQASDWFQSKKSGATSSLGSWFGSTSETPASTYTASSQSTPQYTQSTPQYTPSTPYTASATPTTDPTQSSSSAVGAVGGKRRKMRGGKGGLGLTYYATPVSGLKVVEPNEWLLYNNGVNQQGGSRKRRCKSRRCNSRKRKHKTRRCKSIKH